MNADRFTFSPSFFLPFPLTAFAALALLSAAPAAQAQAVGRGLRGGGAQQQQSAPQQSEPQSAPQQFAQPEPQQSAPVERRANPVWQRPQREAPVQQTPVFNNPRFNTPSPPPPPVRIYGNETRTGPTVSVPDAGERHRQRDHPQGYNNNNNNNNGFGNGTNNGTIWTGGAAPPVGPGNGFFNNQTPPVGPANGFGGTYPNRSRDYPTRQRDYPNRWRGQPRPDPGNTYIYNNYPGYDNYPSYAPPLLGGYYYGNYSSIGVSTYTYPSVYSVYSGFPQYIYGGGGTNVIIIGQPYQPVYDTSFLPFSAPTYSATYNQNNYYVANEARVKQLEEGGAPAQEAIKNAWPAGSYQAAFGDIARAWTDGDVALLKKHLRDNDTRLSVSLNKKYAYSLKSGDYAQITRDALARLGTVSFEFTRLRKAKNGDVTAYGTHVYRAGEATAESAGADGATVPFDQTGPVDGQTDPTDSNGPVKTVYVSYTLRHQADQWYIVSVDSSDTSLVPKS